jgi:hypothetical protein
MHTSLARAAKISLFWVCTRSRFSVEHRPDGVAYANMEGLSEDCPVSRYEPAPLQFVTRRSWYPWLVVGVTCIDGFIGQLDASIVQPALPTIAPNNSATIAAAPDERTGEAGGLLNLMRALGCTIGIATASETFSWRLYVYTGNGHRTRNLPTPIILAATVDVLWVVALCCETPSRAAFRAGDRKHRRSIS